MQINSVGPNFNNIQKTSFGSKGENFNSNKFSSCKDNCGCEDTFDYSKLNPKEKTAARKMANTIIGMMAAAGVLGGMSSCEKEAYAEANASSEISVTLPPGTVIRDTIFKEKPMPADTVIVEVPVPGPTVTDTVYVEKPVYLPGETIYVPTCDMKFKNPVQDSLVLYLDKVGIPVNKNELLTKLEGFDEWDQVFNNLSMDGRNMTFKMQDDGKTLLVYESPFFNNRQDFFKDYDNPTLIEDYCEFKIIEGVGTRITTKTLNHKTNLYDTVESGILTSAKGNKVRIRKDNVSSGYPDSGYYEKGDKPNSVLENKYLSNGETQTWRHSQVKATTMPYPNKK